jgi:hypothetical protein
MRLPHRRQLFDAARRTWHGWSEAKAKRVLRPNQPTPRVCFALPALLLFPRQIVRKAQEIRDAEGFLGACGGHDAELREYGRTSHIHLSSRRPFCGPFGERSLPVGAPIGHHPATASE